MAAQRVAGTPVNAARATADVATHDWRRFWRILLAIIAPLPMLAKGVFYLLYPVTGGDFAKATVTVAAHEQLVVVLSWLDAVFVVGIVPAIAAVVWVSRRGAPRLATVGGLLAVGGMIAAIGKNPDGDRLILVTVQKGLDVATMSKLSDALDANPIAGLASLGFIIAILIGIPMLGIALWRSGAAPAWMGIALFLGAFTHPFLQVNHVLVAAGLVVGAVGFAGASLALLRMSNDDFDLPPL